MLYPWKYLDNRSSNKFCNNGPGLVSPVFSVSSGLPLSLVRGRGWSEAAPLVGGFSQPAVIVGEAASIMRPRVWCWPRFGRCGCCCGGQLLRPVPRWWGGHTLRLVTTVNGRQLVFVLFEETYKDFINKTWIKTSHSLLILFPRRLFLQALLLRLPRLMVKWSSGQGEQAELPNWSVKLPLPHSWHSGALSLNMPGGHATHAESRDSQPAGHVPTRDFSTGLQSGINLVIFQSTLRT